VKPKKREIPPQILYREFRVERASLNIEKRSVDVSFSSETDTVIRWGEPEILDHSQGSVDLTRLNSIGVVLFNHNPNIPIGRIENARIENMRGLATLFFDDDDESDKIFRKVVSGTLKGISVSYTYDDYSFLGDNETSADGRFKGPCLLVKRWTALEISVVSVPADATVGIGRAARDDFGPFITAIVDGLAEKMRKAPEVVSETPPSEMRSGELDADLFWIESIMQ
jgi:hypothetical protein